MCSLDEARSLDDVHEKGSIRNVTGLRWLYAVTKPHLEAHPWGTYYRFLSHLASMKPEIVGQIQDMHVSAFLEEMMGTQDIDNLAFLSVDEAHPIVKSKACPAPSCILSRHTAACRSQLPHPHERGIHLQWAMVAEKPLHSFSDSKL